MAKKLSPKQKGQLARDLIRLTFYQAAVKAGLEPYYKHKRSVSSAGYRIWAEVKQNPKKFGIEPSILKEIEKSVAERQILHHRPADVLPKLSDVLPLKEMDWPRLINLSSKRAWLLLNKRMEIMSKRKKELLRVPVQALVALAGMTFDKTRLVRGEATEHIAFKAKISEDLTPKEKLDLLLKMREKMISAKQVKRDAKRVKV